MSRISNYEELVAEKKKLEADLRRQKAFINAKVNTIREKFEPLRRVFAFFEKVKSSPTSSLLKLGSNVGIDVLVKQKLAKAGWLARLLLPIALKFTASKTIDKVQQKVAH